MNERNGSKARLGSASTRTRSDDWGEEPQRINHQGQRESCPHKQAVDMTAPEMFAEPIRKPLTYGAVQT
jgi:hypothetical protein